MKLFLRTIMIWFLSLSLTALPVVAQSRDMVGSASSESNVSVKILDESAIDVPCQHKAALANMKVALATPPVDEEQTAVTNASMHDGCCCGVDCQCQHDMSCQTISHFSASAIILQATLFISTPLNSQLATESAISYYDCDSDSEVIPPIA